MTTTVTALLVSHDGTRWLSAVLDALASQTRLPDRLVAVDTGSADDSADLLLRRLGPEAVHSLPGTGYPTAVAEALRRLPVTRPDADEDWVWLLHDDSAPAPDALDRLLAAAERDPGADVLGPKLREWPSLRRLLEVGVTLSGTGRRETGLERGEYDQGQHDRPRDVLAVNTAGMLVRRSVLASLGLDPRLPVLGTDLDFGWRVARAGLRTVVVPDAVVFHAEATRRGARPGVTSGRGSCRPHREERRAALYTLLVNGPAAWLPLRWVRLMLGSLLRALGLLLVRAPGEAWDELVALGAVLGRPDRVLAARRSRRRTATVPHRDVRPLLAPFWMPYRHGLDFVTDVGTALAHQASDLGTARRNRSAPATETGPVPDEAVDLPEDTGLLARLMTAPAALVLLGLVLVALWGARGLVGAGMLSGGALLPAPASALDWWRLYLASSHDLGTGSSAPAGPYVLPLALLGSMLLGQAWLLVDVLMLLCVPLAALGGRHLLLRLTGSRPTALWGGLAWGLLPVLGGAVQQGRLGTVVVVVVLPWLVHAALHLHPGQAADRRRRAAWRTSLWLALAAAFAPVVLVLAAAVTVPAVFSGAVCDPRWRRARTVAPAVLPLLVAPVLLLPWSALTWSRQGPASWLTEAGLRAPGLLTPLSWTDVVFARPGGGAPWWLTAGLVVAAVAALARPDTRRPVLAAWLVALVGLAATAILAGRVVAVASDPVQQPVWLGVPVYLAQGAAICAAALAGTGIRDRLSGASFGWRQPVGAVVVLLAVLSPVAGLVWWSVEGSGDPLDRGPVGPVPAYMTDTAATDPARGVLVVRGDTPRGFTYLLLRGGGLRLGDESVLPAASEQEQLTGTVARLATAAEADDVEVLRDLGVGFVHLPAPADPQLAAGLDSVTGLSQVSAGRPAARAWQVTEPADQPPAGPDASAARPWLLVVQGSALVAAVVLAAPSRPGAAGSAGAR